MWRLTVPIRYYLRIDHPEKRKFDLYVPLMLAAVFCLPLLSPGFRSDALADSLDKLGGFLGILTGFYIAALAAVATFGNVEMDVPMPGDPPVRLEHKVNTQIYFENLSRRRFLSFLFGYLAWGSLFLYCIGYGFQIFHKYGLEDAWKPSAFSLFWILYVFGIANLLSNTLLGLFYLTDRIHRPNKVPSWKTPPQKANPAEDRNGGLQE